MFERVKTVSIVVRMAAVVYANQLRDRSQKLIAATCAGQGITRGQLSIHADRGSSMTSKPVALVLADLGITQSHSRPRVSNDNPYSEAEFKTLKYRSGLPRPVPSRSKPPGRIARTSSPGTTTSTAMAGSACTPPLTSTTAGPQPSRPDAPMS
jgi:putative transposase